MADDSSAPSVASLDMSCRGGSLPTMADALGSISAEALPFAVLASADVLPLRLRKSRRALRQMGDVLVLFAAASESEVIGSIGDDAGDLLTLASVGLGSFDVVGDSASPESTIAAAAAATAANATPSGALGGVFAVASSANTSSGATESLSLESAADF